MKISEDVLNILGDSKVECNKLFLEGNLDRKLYIAVNKVLEAVGAKWNKKEKAHIFEGEAADAIDQIILTGEVTRPQDFGYFPTPRPVAEKLLELADIQPDMLILEPSAGQGAIIDVILEAHPFIRLNAIELLDKNVSILAQKATKYIGVGVIQADFLTLTPKPIYDRVVMNPPFEKQADIKHVLHALDFLKSGGELVSVMSASVSFRDNKLTKEFRELVANAGGLIESLDSGSFKTSGTMVNTIIVHIPKM